MRKSINAGISKILLSKEDIKKRVEELGAQITKDYSEVPEEIILVCLLRGSSIFMADLAREIGLSVKLDFMSVSSYGDAKVSSTEVKILKELDEQIMDKHVIVVEDIIDTGRTLRKIKDVLSTRNPKTLKICTLLDKPSRREVEVEVDYVGFSIPDEFVIGYGLDYRQEGRNLPYIGIVGE